MLNNTYATKVSIVFEMCFVDFFNLSVCIKKIINLWNIFVTDAYVANCNCQNLNLLCHNLILYINEQKFEKMTTYFRKC